MAVDKKYIEAISNFADALEALVEALNSKDTDGKTGDGTGSSGMADVNNTLTSISASIDEIKSDTKDIKESSSETLKIAKEIKANQKEGGLFGGDTEKSKTKSIMEGIGTIMLIAGAVIAIGLAFKLVGGVDFTSVVALSFAIVAIGYAFEKIASIKGLDWNTVEMVGGTIVLMSLALAVSSWILSTMSTITPYQFLTAIGIAVALGVVGFALEGYVEAMEKLGEGAILALPITMVLISMALTVSSWFMSYIKPISIPQMATAIGISAAFAIIGFGIGSFIKGIKDAKAKDVLMLPIVMVAIAGAIVAASYILAYTQPITPATMKNVILNAITMAVASTIMAIPIILIGKLLKPKEALTGGLTVLGIVGVIVGASYLLSKDGPIGGYREFGIPNMIDLLFFSAILAVSATIVAIPVFLLGKFLKPKEALTGGLSVLIIAGTIAASSHILALGTYSPSAVPNLKWTIGAVAGILGMSIPVIALGLLSMTGIGLAAVALGAGAALIVAGTIMAASHILALGNYSNAPSLEWAGSTSLLLTVFAAGMGAMGAVILASFGLGAAALVAGAGAVLLVAQTIVDTSFILAKGNYVGGPTKTWAEGISLAIGAFAPVFAQMNKSGVMSIFGDDPMKGRSYGEIMVDIAKSIVKVATYINGSGIDWDNLNGPTAKWAEGIGIAIGAFAPVFEQMNKAGVMAIFGGDPMKGKSYGDVMLEIASSILTVGWMFQLSNGIKWDTLGGPTKEWAGGMSSAIGAFAPVFDSISSGIFGPDPEAAKVLGESMLEIASSILTVGWMFQLSNGIKWDTLGGPTKEWAGGISAAIGAFAPVFDSISSGIFGPDPEAAAILGQSMLTTVEYLVKAAQEMNVDGDIFNVSKSPNVEWANTTGETIKAWSDLLTKLEDDHDIDDINDGHNIAEKIAQSMNTIGAKFSGNMGKDVKKGIVTIKKLSDSFKELAKSVDTLSSSLGSLTDIDLGMGSDLIITGKYVNEGGVDEQTIQQTVNETTQNITNPDEAKVETGGKTIDDLYTLFESSLTTANQQLSAIAGSTVNLSDYVDELRTQGSNVGIGH